MSVCPVCGNRDGTLLYSVDSDTAARRFAEGSDQQRVRKVRSAIEVIWGQPSCDYVRCPQCSFAFAHPFAAATPAFYAALYERGAGYSEWKWEFQRTLDALETLVVRRELQDFTLLDIGAGAGAFASRVLDGITACQGLLCTEYSEYGRDKIETRGIRCVQGGLNDVDTHEHRHAFDVLCLFQVLEHMDDLESVFNRLSLLARDRGHMFIAVPNRVQRSYFDKSGFHEDMPPVHIGRWTRQSLEAIASRHGWRLEEDEIEPEPYLSKLRRFAYQYYASSTSVEALGEVKHRYVRRTLRATLVALFLLSSLPALNGLRSKSLGTAYWAHLSKD
jgi:SAM-dependent methyltransferase